MTHEPAAVGLSGGLLEPLESYHSFNLLSQKNRGVPIVTSTVAGSEHVFVYDSNLNQANQPMCHGVPIASLPTVLDRLLEEKD